MTGNPVYFLYRSYISVSLGFFEQIGAFHMELHGKEQDKNQQFISETSVNYAITKKVKIF